MFSNHFFNWTEQLKDSGFEIHWIDVFDSNTFVKKIDFVHQITGWRNRWDYPGRYWVKNRATMVDKAINFLNQRKLSNVVAEKIQEIKPDVVQSFVLFSGAFPILKVMKKNPGIKWIYSAWGNDLYFMQNIPEELEKIKATLPYFDYMFADCDRDGQLARNLGFKGTYLGTFPGGGGYNSEFWNESFIPHDSREVILIKGYQGMLGRAYFIMEALGKIKEVLSPYRIIVFACDPDLEKSVEELGLSKWNNFQVLGKIPHRKVLKLMGESKIYIGNCISDGMPNTLLEAIVMGAFPIQSNPGGATAELIEHGKNGYLIEDPENAEEIACYIRRAVENRNFVREAVQYSNQNLRPYLERNFIKEKVLKAYHQVETQLQQ
ncbi:hypothetical protein GCM10010465_26660 [Actinomadura fibrosa]